MLCGRVAGAGAAIRPVKKMAENSKADDLSERCDETTTTTRVFVIEKEAG